MTTTLPAGITDFDPLPYNYVRWNGRAWANSWIDNYNQLLARIERRHSDGFNTQHLVDELYIFAHACDDASKHA